jgi:hypothetical protein
MADHSTTIHQGARFGRTIGFSEPPELKLSDEAVILARLGEVALHTGKIKVPLADVERMVEFCKKQGAKIVQVHIWCAEILGEFTLDEGGPNEETTRIWRDRLITHAKTSAGGWETLDSWDFEKGHPGAETDEQILTRVRAAREAELEMSRQAMLDMGPPLAALEAGPADKKDPN